GEQFDRTYGQIQARAHREALQLLERYSKTGEGELKQYATQILPAIKKHMEQLGTLPGAKEAAVPPGGLRPGQRPNN
ncbi:MAG TPA: DUF4142 domain-containing protein, partial [Gemmataceae bacterium]